ncbi:MAG: erythromycin esterase family protein [Bacteroidota bacterium]
MKKYLVILFIFMIPVLSLSQEITLEYIAHNAIDLNAIENGNENFMGFDQIDVLLEGVEIVMLGEQTHLDGATFETKIKLIKYLHQKLGFDLLLFESSMYECEKAWEDISNGGDIRVNMGKAINTFWSPLHEFKPLTDYVSESLNSEHPLEVKGFDNQLGGAIAEEKLIAELKVYLSKTNPSLIDEEVLEVLQDKLLEELWYLNFKKLKKKDAKKIMTYCQGIVSELDKIQNNDEAEYWSRHLNGLISFISDLKFGTEFRDEEMAKNLIWIKASHPGKKIICWGATSHFLYNSSKVKPLKKNKAIEKHYQQTRMMGDYLKEKYQDKVYTIGFTTYEGEYGTTGYGAIEKIEKPNRNSLEFLLGQAKYHNYLLPFEEYLSTSLPSRPLGYQYIKSDLTAMMDAIIFNRTMKKANLDKALFIKLYPDHKYIK